MSSALNTGLEATVVTVPPRATLEQIYLTMRTITLADECICEEARTGALQATFYPVRGLEAVCAALGIHLTPADYLVSTYRNLGDAIAKRVSLRAIFAEIYGRSTGTSKGKGGPMHLHDVAQGLMATTGIVGSGLPIAVGLALAAQLRHEPRVTVCTFGDGATSIGAYHEAMNMAALWDLPVLFLCQNNQWAEHTPLAGYARNRDFAARAASYGVTSNVVDGFDPVATWAAIGAATEHIRAGNGPYFLECQTYRLTGHTSLTDHAYMPADELAAAQSRDPGPAFRAWLESKGLVSAYTLGILDQQAQATVADALEFAHNSPAPGPEELLNDVFASALEGNQA